MNNVVLKQDFSLLSKWYGFRTFYECIIINLNAEHLCNAYGGAISKFVQNRQEIKVQSIAA